MSIRTARTGPFPSKMDRTLTRQQPRTASWKPNLPRVTFADFLYLWASFEYSTKPNQFQAKVPLCARNPSRDPQPNLGGKPACLLSECRFHAMGGSDRRRSQRNSDGESSLRTLAEICGKAPRTATVTIFSSEQDKASSSRSTAPSNGQGFDCPHCKSSWVSKEKLAMHVIQRHAEYITERFKCPKCTEMYVSAATLQVHVEEKHAHRSSRKCPHSGCDKRFKSPSRLQSHVSSVHDKRRPFACPKGDCDKKFSKRGDQEAHVQLEHHGLAVNACDVCSKSFSRIANKERHMRTQHGHN